MKSSTSNDADAFTSRDMFSAEVFGRSLVLTNCPFFTETDAVADGNYYYELAVYALKCRNTSKAYSCAQKAMELNPELNGKAYMIMGTVWGSTVCSGNEIERRAPYWVAVDFMVKAKNADETLAEDANNYIRQYSAYFPQTAEAFMYNITDGDPYTVSCNGLRESTKVRTQD